MGAELIGYIVKGPIKLPKNAEQLVTKHLIALRDKLIKSKVIKCSNCGYIVSDGLCNGCGTEQVITKESTNEEIIQFAKEMVIDWPPEFRDCNSRTDPDNNKRLIVFAGDQTWGDTPDGGGFCYLQRLLSSGAADVLGIQ